MSANGDSYLSVDAWIIANIGENSFKETLGKYIDLTELKKTLEAIRGGKKIDNQTADEALEALEQYGIDLNKKAIDGELDPVIGRDEEIQRVMQIFNQKDQRITQLLIGEPGTG